MPSSSSWSSCCLISSRLSACPTQRVVCLAPRGQAYCVERFPFLSRRPSPHLVSSRLVSIGIIAQSVRRSVPLHRRSVDGHLRPWLGDHRAGMATCMSRCVSHRGGLDLVRRRRVLSSRFGRRVHLSMGAWDRALLAAKATREAMCETRLW
ncbi:uncharacterized protein J3D65DRAFT_628997 [Phyllosticta citribraziliensis]|uniref:Uncharacterized protein n=1 Tax=Phyllosticta citribraziliensis TaxID=989973 RepID=A0ABR1LHU1_9PEZI